MNTAIGNLIITTDIAEETAIVGYDRFSNNRALIELMFGNIKNRLTTIEAVAARTDQGNTFAGAQVIVAAASTGAFLAGRAVGDGATDYAFLQLANNANTISLGSLWSAADAGDLKVSGDTSVAVRTGDGGVTGGTDRMTITSGIQVGVPTGGDLGMGTLNVAGDIAENGVRLWENENYLVASDVWS